MFEEYSDEEREILEKVAERRGEEYVADNAELILDQARMAGDLVDEDEE